ncbi:MAG: cysQ [Gammaproteobacteria bacterium]|nr:cysQ [Gammaproteobacteria bacterium]
MSKIDTTLLRDLKEIASGAALLLMALYEQGLRSEQIGEKSDKTPVTEADLMAHAYLSQALQKLTPTIPIISEEALIPDFKTRQTWPRYWLIDPLDGTKEFLENTDEFAINIALIEHQQPVLGLVYLPVTKTCYYAKQGMGAYKQIENHEPQAICTRSRQSRDEIIVLTSRRNHGKRVAAFTEALPNAHLIRYGSTVKLCLIAEGSADVYMRFSRMLEWDLAAGHCILKEAGGQVCLITGEALAYNTPELMHPNFFAIGCPDYPWQSAIAGLIK